MREATEVQKRFEALPEAVQRMFRECNYDVEESTFFEIVDASPAKGTVALVALSHPDDYSSSVANSENVEVFHKMQLHGLSIEHYRREDDSTPGHILLYCWESKRADYIRL